MTITLCIVVHICELLTDEKAFYLCGCSAINGSLGIYEERQSVKRSICVLLEPHCRSNIAIYFSTLDHTLPDQYTAPKYMTCYLPVILLCVPTDKTSPGPASLMVMLRILPCEDVAHTPTSSS